MTDCIKFVRAYLPLTDSISLDCYMAPNGEKRIGITGAALAAGRSKNYLVQVTERESKPLKDLYKTGFTGKIIEGIVYRENVRGSSLVKTISISDFTKYITWEATFNGMLAAAQVLEKLLGSEIIEPGTIANLYLFKQINSHNNQKHGNPENLVRDNLCKELDGFTEVSCKSGRIDVLTDSQVIEIKQVKSWKSAIGQVLVYALEYPDRQPRIHLFGACSLEYKQLIIAYAGQFNVLVTFESYSNQENDYLNVHKDRPAEIATPSVQLEIPLASDTCVRCGTTNGLHKHHVNVWRGGLRQDRSFGDELISLCGNCHAWVHSYSNQENDYLNVHKDRPAEIATPASGYTFRGEDRSTSPSSNPYLLSDFEREFVSKLSRSRSGIMSIQVDDEGYFVTE